MKNEFVPYEEALSLKELGFNDDCLGWFRDKVILYGEKDGYDEVYGLKAPLYQQAFRWFREKHDKQSWIHKPAFGKFYFVIENKGGRFNYNTHEEAELACLRKLIELVKNERD